MHVKLVAEVGVGTVAAGVSKAKADVVLISGHDGGTGASPLTSLKHAGAPWELGLAETQQTLLLNGLRDRIVVQTDGQLKTGRDVIIAALLGAEEFGFATAPLVVSGCIMMRVCHLDTCPVGVATQNPVLRAAVHRQAGVRRDTSSSSSPRRCASTSPRSASGRMAEAIGHVECLDTRAAVDHWKATGLDLTPILHKPESPWEQDLLLHQAPGPRARAGARQRAHRAGRAGARRRPSRCTIELPIRNVNRTVGTMLGHEVTKRYGGDGLPDDTIDVHLHRLGRAELRRLRARGASPCGSTATPTTTSARGSPAAGSSCGRRSTRHPAFVAEDNIIAGNVILYGATGGEVFLRGVVGERFCVRNSGATAVVEGVGDHGCEYMTGGRVVVLGPTGRNFGAGMSGGIAFVCDPDDTFPTRLNGEMVDLDPLDDEDREWLRDVIRRAPAPRPARRSPSGILARWHDNVRAFVKVFPKDYKRVLEAIAIAEETGRDVDEAIMAAAHG